MLPGNAHLSENDLVMAADGELPPKRRAEIAAHLESCWSCRERMLSLQNTIADFVRARNSELDPLLPPVAGPRALLRARLAESRRPSSGMSFLRPFFPAFRSPGLPIGRLAVAAAAFLGILLVLFQSTVNAEGPKPRFGLTPGETRPITLEGVCLYSNAEVTTSDIPEDVRQKVFAAYGIKSSQANQFEVDYLITPDLGGTESIRNLWPQPYSARWNARVKDKLEARLHELVCGHKLDLATAQHDIAFDWIAAYRKYVGPNTSN